MIETKDLHDTEEAPDMSTEAPLRVACVVGTRPEAIKMAPVVLELKKDLRFEPRLLATGQHAQMLYQALEPFGLEPDEDLKVMRDRQSLDYITASVLEGVGAVLDSWKPRAVLVHGDTTTTLAASLASFYRRIPVGHVEAGLRSGDLDRPFPEEMNRVVTDRLSSLWFAPTEGSRENLLREGVEEGRIWVTGNTVIDALLWIHARGRTPEDPALAPVTAGAPFLLVTAHRRESWGEPLERIARSTAKLLEDHPALYALVPMHRNPEVRTVLRSHLGDQPRALLCDPLDYPDFVWAMAHSRLILSDSGGVQEEASALKKPVLILREVTERPEALETGSGLLVGTSERRILEEAGRLLADPAAYETLQQRCGTPFGDGRASERIAQALWDTLTPDSMRESRT